MDADIFIIMCCNRSNY